MCRRAGIWVLLAGSVLATLPVFSTFLPMDLGISPRLEPMPMVLHLAAAICALGVVLLFLGNREAVLRALSHPMVLCALFVAVWSAALAPFMDYPWLSFLGATVFGEAIVRYVSLAVFFAAALLLAEDRLAFRLLCLVLTLVSFVAPLVIFVFASDFFVSLDLVGPFAIPAAVGCWLLFAGRPNNVRILLAIFAAVPAAVLSTNQTVSVLLVLVAFPSAVLAHWVLRRKPDWHVNVRTIAIIGVLAAPAAGLAVKWLLPEIISVPSIESRHLLDKVLYAALRAEPSILLFGQGWGAVNLTFDSFALSSGAVMWDGSWDLAARNVSHTHSVFGEALFGAGLPAVGGVLAMLAAPLLVVKTEDLPLTVFAVFALACISAVTGEFAATVGAGALAFGLAGWRPEGGSTGAAPRFAGRILALAMPAVAGALFVASGWAFANANEIRLRTADIYERGTRSLFSCAPHPHSALYADMDLMRGLVRHYRPVFERAEKGQGVPEGELRVIDAYVCAAEERARTSRSPSLHIGLETFRTDVALGAQVPETTERYRDVLQDWPQKIARALNAAPARTDLPLGFLASQMAQGKLGTVDSLSRAMLDRNAGDPVAMWFLGLVQVRLNDPAHRDEGWRLLRESLDAGIERILPIAPITIQGVRNSGR